ncbi:MAG: response regulator [Afipia sp.]|nr:response regulator [Afipia sp.]
MAAKSRAKRNQRKALKPAKRRVARKRLNAVAGKSRTKASPKRAPAHAVETALAAFAHEVRTPLTGILAISSLLATSDLGERERRWVETIKVGAEHLASLATLFVDAARGGGLRVRSDFFDLRTLAQTAGDSLAGRASAKGLKSMITIADNLPVFAIGDPVRLRAALENLIDNAVKFTERGGVALDVSVQANAKDRLRVAFAVSDSGIGISPAEIRRLFKPFSQANLDIASRFGGAGLGLSSVRQLARAMGGDVSIRSRDGNGATFILTVLLKPAANLSGPTSSSRNKTPPQSKSLRVLSVEDNPFGRVVLNAILTELGHVTEFIGSGEEAPKRVLNGQFDAVLMDMVLPGISGVEAIKRVRALAKPHGMTAIIGVSGKADDENASRAAGADAFLVKPVSPRALATALLEATRHRADAT